MHGVFWQDIGAVRPDKLPLGVFGGIHVTQNTIAHVDNNALIYVDPLGLSHCVQGAIYDFTPEMNHALQ